MINLLPKIDENAVKKIYKRRLAVIIGAMLGFGIVFGIVMLVPSKLLVNYQEGIVELQKELILSETSLIQDESFDQYIKEVSQQVRLFDRFGYRSIHTADDILRPILENQVDGARIGQLIYRVNSLEPGMEITGVTLGRKELLDFVVALRSHEGFLDVHVPIQFYADRNTLDYVISFSLDTSYEQ